MRNDGRLREPATASSRVPWIAHRAWTKQSSGKSPGWRLGSTQILALYLFLVHPRSNGKVFTNRRGKTLLCGHP